MAMPDPGKPGHPQSAVIPLSRIRAASRALPLLAGAVGVGYFCLARARHLEFTPNAISNRIEDWSILTLLIPLALLSLYLGFWGLAWLLLALWPGQLGFELDEKGFRGRLGPFGSFSFDSGRLKVTYPFDLPEEETEGQVEAYFPEEMQRMTLIPRIKAAPGGRDLKPLFRRFTALAEQDVAALCWPVFTVWRGERPDEILQESTEE